ncbi:hypothetical protein NDU88_002932 [Pleurodeles waltl]|uniref:Secreted protein n=1 Tax=Pleurodeles waltl TaxID=8319 RepID=A0AAV7W4K8_PLEWA|nr:hypothetical protein NDU88_002932 [Pleurodeles waltl]
MMVAGTCAFAFLLRLTGEKAALGATGYDLKRNQMQNSQTQGSLRHSPKCPQIETTLILGPPHINQRPEEATNIV